MKGIASKTTRLTAARPEKFSSRADLARATRVEHGQVVRRLPCRHRLLLTGTSRWRVWVFSCKTQLDTWRYTIFCLTFGSCNFGQDLDLFFVFWMDIVSLLIFVDRTAWFFARPIQNSLRELWSLLSFASASNALEDSDLIRSNTAIPVSFGVKVDRLIYRLHHLLLRWHKYFVTQIIL